MNILITNDDGIHAAGIEVLVHIARQLTTDDKIWVVAPLIEQSGVGHCLSYTAPMRVHKMGSQRFAIQGYPADCVIAGLHQLAKDISFDLVLSGVNAGNNSAENATYSGTLGAALEASLQGNLGIALSQFLGPKTKPLDNPFEAAQTHGAALIQEIMAIEREHQETRPYASFYNVNFPPVPAKDVKGRRVIKQGRRPIGGMQSVLQTSPTGREYIWIQSGGQHDAGAPNTDVAANLDGYISITPMRADWTDYDRLEGLKSLE